MSQNKKPDGLSQQDASEMKKVPWFKYVAWNDSWLGEEEEGLDKTFNENNIKSSIFTESKKRDKMYENNSRLWW
jgi:hypothetical protein